MLLGMGGIESGIGSMPCNSSWSTWRMKYWRGKAKGKLSFEVSVKD